MRNSENHKKHVNYFFNGADYDIHPDLASAKQGFYKDAKNMRLPTGSGSIKRIDGETLKYYTQVKGYSCIGSIEVNGNVVEVWVSDNVNESLGLLGTVRFRINGVVMLETSTSKLKFVRTRKLQMDKADDCAEGLFFITDNFDVPYIFSLKDIIDNFSPLTTKYFADFNQSLYSVNLKNYQNIPVFRELTKGSLEVGKYAYAIRFVDKDGNKTRFGIPTPMIPVPLNYEKGSNAHPYNSTHGGLLETSPYGITLQFRVNNTLNYQYIEILRLKVNTLQALNEVPEAEYRPLTPELIDGEVSVRTFIDDGTYTDWIEFTDDESTDTMAAIGTAKCVRYYNNQLILANIKLASRDITDKITFSRYLGEVAFPFIDNLGEVGYNSPHNSAYKTSYMSGERYGFGIACLDWQNNIAFVVPIPDDTGTLDFKNYQFPDRRDTCSAATFDLSENYWKGVPRASDKNNNDNVPVHEKFSKGKSNEQVFKTDYSYRSIRNNNYIPYTPKSFTDTDVSGDNINPCDHICTKLDCGAFFNTPQYNSIFYSPDYSLKYYGMGIAISGIDSLPEWVTAFCVVRTKPANRVVCQGITTYSINDYPQSRNQIKNGFYSYVDKDLDKVCFFSDDIKNGYTGTYIDNSFNNRKFQPVSPLGYFSEMYSGQDFSSAYYTFMYSRGIDIMIYARDFYTDPNDQKSPALFDYYGYQGNSSPYWTRFGKWRNKTTDQFNGDNTFKILRDVNEKFKGVGQDGYLKITLDNGSLSGASLYKNDSPQHLIPFNGYIMDSNDSVTKLWHEPFYISNIIDDSKNVTDVNQQEYILTGHYQKVRSIIGKGNDQEQDIPLVDERFEDCCVNKFNAIRPAYIYIKDTFTGVEKAWVDITTYLSTPAGYAQNVINSLMGANHYYDSVDPISGDTVRCYGAYTHVVGSNIVETGDWTIQFHNILGLDKQYCIPSLLSEIIVKYDTRFPIKAFGGDVTIGESIFNWVDGQSNNNGGIPSDKQLFAWVGFPYTAYRQDIQMDDAGTNNSDQSVKYIPSNIFRQIIVSSIVESRVNLPYSYQQSSGNNGYNRANNFPRVHYVIRPMRWNASNITTSNFGTGKIDNQYLIDYPFEYTAWDRGGFRSFQAINRDYSKGNNYNKLFSKPQVGFEEKTVFCTRNMWSLKRNINVQDDPNLKTFLSLNIFDISDRQGEIKFLYDNDSQKGNNLFALTDSGVCLLITDKRTISDINSNDLFALDADKLIMGQYWLSKEVGLSSENWRGVAEYNNMLFFPSSESIYLLFGLELKDILRVNKGSYYNRLHPVLQSVTESSPMTAVYDIDNKEYWLYIGSTDTESPYDGVETIDGVDADIITPKKLTFGGLLDSDVQPRIDTPKTYDGETFVYKMDSEVFTGTYDYMGDKFLCVQGGNTAKKLSVLIMRNYETYEANLGVNINGSAVDGRVTFVTSPEGVLHKEFIDSTINSSLIPVKVELLNTGTTVEGTQTYFKNYGGYYYQIPRKTVSKLRFQGKALVVEVYNDVTGTFEITSVETGYKIIK